MRYPCLLINQGVIYKNCKKLINLCADKGVAITAVIKGFNAEKSVCDAIVAAGCGSLASSRLSHLREVKKRYHNIETWALRIPMFSEVEDVVRYSDVSLNSEVKTLILLNEEAKRQHKLHRVVLMRDVGDLREGIMDSRSLCSAALEVEKRLGNIRLYGIGTSLGCYGSIQPTRANITELAENAEMIEDKIGRRLDIVSGGSASSLKPLFRNELPAKINHLRVGTPLVLYSDRIKEWMDYGKEDITFTLSAEIIELGYKPTKPYGESGKNFFGNSVEFVDRGIRKRALLALGAFDIGSYDKVEPLDPQAKVLGCSSDHMIVDIEDCTTEYQLGGKMDFALTYQSMLFSTASRHIRKHAVNLLKKYTFR